MNKILCLCLLTFILGFSTIEAKKVRNNFRVDKETGKMESVNDKRPGREIQLRDSTIDSRENPGIINSLRKCTFSGYDKEPNSSQESFILINNAEETITGFEVRIDYLDMQGRMLHSRDVEESCYVPGGESRRVDIPSWDKQRTYYYYLGNEPRKVATPYQVVFTPKTFWVE